MFRKPRSRGRRAARKTSLSLVRGDGINKCEGLLRVVDIGTGQLDREGDPSTVTDQMSLAPEFGSVGGTGTSFVLPKTARTHCEKR